jgi:tocopherol O-methyltransferase
MAEIVSRDGAVIGIDISSDLVARCKRRSPPEWLSYGVGDATQLAQPDASFDAVVSVQVAEYISDVNRALAGAFRVVRLEPLADSDQASVACSTPSLRAPRRRSAKSRWLKPSYKIDGCHPSSHARKRLSWPRLIAGARLSKHEAAQAKSAPSRRFEGSSDTPRNLSLAVSLIINSRRKNLLSVILQSRNFLAISFFYVIVSGRPINFAEVADHYDELDAFYRDLWGEHLHHGLWQTGRETSEEAVGKMVRLVAKQAEIATGERVLDIGSGYGATARLLARELGARVTAITISRAQYYYAKNRDRTTNPKYLLGDWLTTELLPESFDAGVAIESSEHMPDTKEFFQRALAILAPGGRLVVCSWLAKEGVNWWQTRWLLEPICREGRIPHLLCAPELIAKAEAAGLKAGEWQDLTDQVWRTWPIVVWR